MRIIRTLSACLLAACSTARLRPPPPINVADSGGQRLVIVEPFFEASEWKLSTRTEHATVYGPGYGPPGYGPGYGPGYAGPRDVTIYRDIAEKPVYARVPTLAQEQRGVIGGVQRLRPRWRVTSTSELMSATGPVTLIRVIVGEPEILESNRSLKTIAFAFGIIIWPLLLVQITPVSETQRVHGMMIRFDAEAAELRPKLLRYPTQPDFAVDTRGMVYRQQPFGLDLEYQEGVLASESSREPVLVSGFVERLSTAVVALAEGVK
ncbi:MAG TPA: hypothetical protein VKE49_10370 [Myxococcaceae bacterium]|nr:hypothetical protein [Myxococcaceae bacterium]